MTLRLHQIDAFTERPFAGNPAAVCLLDAPRDERWMLAVAAEMNLSETAFLVRRGGDGEDADGFDLRWFTPACEVDLCGHATLASAHRLWEGGELAAGEEARFHTRSGLLTARRGGDGWIEMDFPARRPREVEPPAGLAEALGAPVRWTGAGGDDLLALLDDEAAVRGLAPDLGAVARLPVRGLIVTAAADPGADHDFVSRFFAPAVGVPEDPVTGSAHCCLGPFWAARLGREEVVGFQASARGGVVRVRPREDRVTLAGRAVTVLVAELTAEAGKVPAR
ncbi:MAG TPA: PhzF family phenazine biosynthesis protein [Thermoanaerobaculia bacterium]|nr:PhzF family phenazine biosynthesis protein [Thermoanaerobaculia bacterium]